MSTDFEQQEYFALIDIINEFDKRLVTVKGWGVTLSLAALGLGFQHKSYGFFLLAAASSLIFWIIELRMKKHQMQYYPRMREIEYHRYRFASEKEREYSSPRVDWSWNQAKDILKGNTEKISNDIQPRGYTPSYKWIGLYLHVSLPHLITFTLGTLLLVLAKLNCCYLSEYSF